MDRELIKVDSCIIGSSINGLWIAIELAKRGQKVLLIDKTHIGSEKNSIDVCIGHVCDPKMYPLANEALKKWFQINKHSGTELGVELKGSVSFSLGNVDMARLEGIQSSLDLPEEEAHSFVLKDRNAIKSLLKIKDLGDSVNGALVGVTDLTIDNQTCVKGLRNQLINLGSQFWGSDEVTDFDIENGSIKAIITKEARIEAKNVVLATGARTNKLLEKLKLEIPIRPAKAHIIEYTSKTRMPKQILHYKTPLGDYICKPLLNGRNLLIYTGIDDQIQATWSKKVNDQTVFFTFLQMIRILPILEYVDIKEVNSSQLAITPDRLPFFGKTKFYDNLYMNVGFAGSKYLFIPLFAEKLADLIVSKKEAKELSFINPDRAMKQIEDEIPSVEEVEKEEEIKETTPEKETEEAESTSATEDNTQPEPEQKPESETDQNTETKAGE